MDNFLDLFVMMRGNNYRFSCCFKLLYSSSAIEGVVVDTGEEGS